MNGHRINRLLIIAFCAAVSACTVGPDYTKPDIDVTEAWVSNDETVQLLSTTEHLSRWWEQFDDPLLNTLIARAIENNLDIEIARARFLEARAGRRFANANTLPQVNSSASYQRQSFSQERASPEAGLSNAGLIDRQNNFYELGFDASFEIDIFGGNRRRNEAALARFHAAEVGIQEVQSVVLAELGRAYIEIRGLQFERRSILRNIQIQQDTLAIIRSNQETGLATGLDIDRQLALLESTQAEIPGLDARIDANIFAISTLCGDLPNQWVTELREEQSMFSLPLLVEAGLPPEILRRRPDIRRMERELAAATADVGSAIANLYPRFFLSGLGAFQSENSGSLLTSAAWAFGIGPMVQLPLFQGGKLRANVDDKEADLLRAELNYEKSILTALSEIESKLKEYSSLQQTLARLNNAIDAARSANGRASQLHRDGLTNFLSVLDAERELVDIEKTHARQQTATAVSLIGLYKSLGGGWDDNAQIQG